MAPELNTIWQECAAILLPVAVAAVGALATYALALLRSWIKAKTAAIEDKTARAAVEHAMSRLDHIAGTIVKELNQRAKHYAADGRITSEEAGRLKGIAMEQVRDQIPPYLRETLERSLGDLDRYVSSKIEAKVFDQKPQEKKPCA